MNVKEAEKVFTTCLEEYKSLYEFLQRRDVPSVAIEISDKGDFDISAGYYRGGIRFRKGDQSTVVADGFSSQYKFDKLEPGEIFLVISQIVEHKSEILKAIWDQVESKRRAAEDEYESECKTIATLKQEMKDKWGELIIAETLGITEQPSLEDNEYRT